MIIVLTFCHAYEGIQARLNLNSGGLSLYNGALIVQNLKELIEGSVSKNIWFFFEAMEDGSEESVFVGDKLLFGGVEEQHFDVARADLIYIEEILIITDLIQ